MIKYNPKIWFVHIFKFYKSDTLKILLPEIIVMGLYSYMVCYIELHYVDNLPFFKNAISMHSMIGIVLSLLLVFRTNTAYDRWWEGRKLWGQLINCSRNASIKIKSIIGAQQNGSGLLELLAAFPASLQQHLRGNKNPGHPPMEIVNEMYALLKSALNQKTITGEEYLSLDRELAQLMEICGACERIKSTPIPFSYNTFIKKFIFIYSFTLPLGLVPDFYYWSVPVSMFIFYVLVSIEILAEEIEDPFGDDENDLPMEEMARRIRENVLKP